MKLLSLSAVFLGYTACCSMNVASAFMPPQMPSAPAFGMIREQHQRLSHLKMMTSDLSDIITTTAAAATNANDVVASNMNSLLIAETEAWVQPVVTFLDPFLNIMSFLMLVRVVLSWYPSANIKEFPWVAAVLPTEALLKSVKNVIPPAFGVDVTPVSACVPASSIQNPTLTLFA